MFLKKSGFKSFELKLFEMKTMENVRMVPVGNLDLALNSIE